MPHLLNKWGSNFLLLLLASHLPSCGGGNGGVAPVTTTTLAAGRPTASCGGPYGPVEAGDPFTFDGRGSTSPNPPINTYAWDFGDGTQGSGATPTHTYQPRDDPPSSRDFTVRLMVTDAAGRSDNCQTTCTVTGLY
jgi:hypothetical protein